jgi:mannose/cellobiose epimerase-like protein (N-acyl-D-glucosamine 2-epimerase family)
MSLSANFSFSDLIAGYVTKFNESEDTFGLKTSDGREFSVKLSPMAYAKLIQNFDEGYPDATGSMRSMLLPGRYVFAYGIFYPDSDQFDAKQLVFAGLKQNEYVFEKQDWWVKQVNALGKFYLKAQFGEGDYDYRRYRTSLNLAGLQTTSFRQETDTISRLVYGFATAFMMTGNDSFLKAAERGTDYLREHMRFVDLDEGIVYWYHGIDVSGDRETKIFASEFGDDYYAIPAYEQIYALAGPIQTYRCTGDPQIMDDTEKTIKLFNDFFLDKSDYGGYFSHLDPLTLDPRSDALGNNKGRKNWNSVGDHAPAYLINLWLATGKQEYADMLEYTFDTIEKYFPDYENSPFVQERFYEDWSHDTSWGWQQNRAVVGHNLKIAWNLMRMQSLKAKDKYVALSQKIADLMPGVGSDQQRGGWYDVVERLLAPGETQHRFVWHDRKAWWQQEQSILAYLILTGTLSNQEYHRLSREASAFYNAWFLDLEDGGVYFNVLANGIPYLAGGNERGKGSHSMSGYHSFELCYLAAVYTNLLITKQPMDFYFKPIPGGFPDNILRVSPDILPPGSIKITKCEIDGEPYSDYDADALTVNLPKTTERVKVKVQISPV